MAQQSPGSSNSSSCVTCLVAIQVFRAQATVYPYRGHVTTAIPSWAFVGDSYKLTTWEQGCPDDPMPTAGGLGNDYVLILPNELPPAPLH